MARAVRDTDGLISAIDTAAESAYGEDMSGPLSSDRAYAINLYLGKNVDPVPEGRSSVVDRSVFETIQWMLPSLCRVFANGDDVVTLPPVGPEDEAGAKQEGEYLNYVITRKNKWFQIFYEWATDALLTKNAYALAYNEKRSNSIIEKYDKQTPEGLALLTQDSGTEIIAAKEYPDTGAQQMPPMVDPQTGQPIQQPPAMLYDVEIRRTEEQTVQCIRILPPERTLVSESTTSWRLDECDYFEYWDSKSLSELRSLGFDVDDDVAEDSVRDGQEDIARNQFNEQFVDEKRPTDPSMRKVRARMIWIRYDYDGDGISELNYIVRVGQEILYREECNRIPVASIVPNPLPHRHLGLSIADITSDIQRIKTAILRQGLDNLYLSNNPIKIANTNMVNVDDLLVSRPGHVIRTNGDINNAFRHDVPPFVFPQAMEGLEYMDSVRENRTGTNRYFTGVDQNALNKTATGIQTLSTMAAQRVEQIARIFASGVEDLCSIVHELILKAGHKKQVVQLRGQWVEVDPATWRKRTDFKIAVGFTAGNKDALISRLQLLRQAQVESLQLGLPIVTPENIYETSVELTKAADFSSPDNFWTNPNKIPPKPQGPPPEVQLAQIESTTKLHLKAADIEQRSKEKTADVELAKYQTDTEARTKLALGHMQHSQSIEAAQHQATLTDHSSALDRQAVADDATTDRTESQSIVDALVQNNEQQTQTIEALIENFTKAMTGIQKSLTAPKMIVKDKDGRPIGMQAMQ